MSKLANKQGQIQIPCSDAIGPAQRKEASQSLVFSAITLTDAVWRQGHNGLITITFGENCCSGCSPDAAWSFIGNQSNNKIPSMNLGFIDPPFNSFNFKGKTYKVPLSATRNYCSNNDNMSNECKNNPNKTNCGCDPNWVPGATVIHEFGHALGMLHEHQNNLFESNPIKLNINAVKTYYRNLGMGDEGAATNVIDTYQCDDNNCEYDGTKYDKKSIMLYYLPDDWIIGDNPTRPNFVLSDEDKGWLKEIYPKDSTKQPHIIVAFIDPNPEPWKTAWVEKIVTEVYGPLIGIKWLFISITDLKDFAGQLTKKVKEVVNDTNDADDIIEDIINNKPFFTCNSNGALSYRGNELTEEKQINVAKTGTLYSPGQLAGIIIGSIIGFVLLCLLIYFLASRKLYV